MRFASVRHSQQSHFRESNNFLPFAKRNPAGVSYDAIAFKKANRTNRCRRSLVTERADSERALLAAFCAFRIAGTDTTFVVDHACLPRYDH